METEENFVARWEGFRALPYRDIAGQWTVGYGHRLAPGETMHSVSEESARALLASELTSIREAVDSMVHVSLTPGQREALVDFAYNLGLESLRRSTLLRLLNSGDYAGAADQFLRWDHYRDAAGREVVSAGLKLRRTAERTLFLSGMA